MKMKKKFLLGFLIALLSLTTYGCMGIYGTSLYPTDQDQENLIIDPYHSQFIYTNDYLNFGWDNLDGGNIYCSYFDFYNVVLVLYGNRIFIIPYDFFYYHLWLGNRFSISFYSFDYFANMFGIGYYNYCWDRYYWNYHREHYYRNYNYYYNHRQYHPTVLRKEQITDPSKFHSIRNHEATPTPYQRRFPTAIQRPTPYSYHSDSRISSRPNTPYTPKHSTSPYRSNSNNSRPTSRGTSHSTFRNSGGSTPTKHKH